MRTKIFETLNSRPLLREVLILCFFALGYGIVFSPALQNISTHYFGGARQDPGIYIWLTEDNIRHFFHWPSSGFDANFFFPWGKALAYTDNYLLPSLFAMPVRLLTGNLTLAVNFAFLVAFVLNGYCTYRLVHLITHSRAAGLISGFAFMCQPFLYEQLGHSQLQYAYCFPAAVWAACSFARTRSALSASGVGAAVAAGFFSSAYYGLFCYLLAGLTLLLLAILSYRTLRVRDVLVLGVANIPWIFLLALTMPAYKAVRETFGSWNLWVAKKFSATFLNYFGLPGRMWLWGKHLHKFAHAEANLFMGMTVFVLACAAIAWTIWTLMQTQTSSSKTIGRTYGALAFFAAQFAVAMYYTWRRWGFFIEKDPIIHGFAIGVPMWEILVCAFGMLILRAATRKADAALETVDFALSMIVLMVFFYFASLGVVEGHGPLSPKPGLYSWMFRFLPGYDSLRAVSRIGIVTDFTLVVLAGIAYAEFLKRYRQATVFSFAGLLLVMGVEYHPVRYPLEQMAGPPEIYQRLAKIPGDEAVIALPYGNPKAIGWYSQLQTEHIQWMQAAGVERPLFNGYSGKMPASNVYTERSVKNFPDQTSLNYLGRFVGLRYLLYYRIRVSPFYPEPFEKAIAKMGDQLKVVDKDPKLNYIFELNPTVDVYALTPAEFCLKIDREHSRTLQLEIKYVSSTLDKFEVPVQVGWNLDSQGVKTEAVQLVKIEKSNVWQKVDLQLVPSTHSVVPHKVVFQPLDLQGGKLFVRNLKLKTP